MTVGLLASPWGQPCQAVDLPSGRRCSGAAERSCLPVRSLSQPHLPEPLDLLAALGVMPVDGVLLPVIQVNFLHATQHQLGKKQGEMRSELPAQGDFWGEPKTRRSHNGLSAGEFSCQRSPGATRWITFPAGQHQPQGSQEAPAHLQLLLVKVP